MPVAIVSDSTGYLPRELVEQNGIQLVSLYINWGDESQRELEMANFDAFYAGPDPVLRLDGIDGVVSFPSFHAVMGFITVAMWRHGRIALPLALAWLAFMLLATFPYGGHYVVDILGGLAVWAAWFGLSRRLEARSVAR